MKSLTSNKKGFTLIELLVVLLIIGLLATISVVALGTARAKGRDTRRLTDVKGIQNALELYFLDVNGYPAVGSATVLGTAASTGRFDTAGFGVSTGTGTPVYMVKVPANPTPNGAAYTYTSTAADNVTACTSGACPSYTLTFNLESGAGGYTSGAHTATPPDVIQ